MMLDLADIFVEQSDIFCKEINPPIFVDKLSFWSTEYSKKYSAEYSTDGARHFGLIECQGRCFHFFCDVTVFFMHEVTVDYYYEDDNDALLDESNIYTNFHINKIEKQKQDGDIVSFHCDRFDLEIEVIDDYLFPRQAKWR